MMLSFRAMVEGQLSTYEQTNHGLTREAEETDGLLSQLRQQKIQQRQERITTQRKHTMDVPATAPIAAAKEDTAGGDGAAPAPSSGVRLR